MEMIHRVLLIAAAPEPNLPLLTHINRRHLQDNRDWVLEVEINRPDLALNWFWLSMAFAALTGMRRCLIGAVLGTAVV